MLISILILIPIPGIGVGKKEYLRMEMGPGSMRVMGDLKTALDPRGTLNPGKVLDVPLHSPSSPHILSRSDDCPQ
jgi:hypothetical protein